VCKAFLQGQGEVCQGVDWEVFPQWRRGDFRPPAKGEVNGGEAFREVPGRILGSEGGEVGEGRGESGRGWVGVWGAQATQRAASRLLYLH